MHDAKTKDGQYCHYPTVKSINGKNSSISNLVSLGSWCTLSTKTLPSVFAPLHNSFIMAAYGWLSRNANAQQINHKHPRLQGSMVIACRLCDKIFTSNQSLIEHYESHEEELALRAPGKRTNLVSNHQERDSSTNHFHLLGFRRQEERMNDMSNQREVASSNYSFRPNLSLSFALNVYRPFNRTGCQRMQHQVHDVDRVANTTHNVAPPPTQPQPPRYPISINNHLVTPSSNPIPVPAGNRVANTNQSSISQPTTRLLLPQVHLSTRSNYKVGQQPVVLPKVFEQKGLDVSVGERTNWYLGQLDRPIPMIIDLESCDGNRGGNSSQNNLDLRLKL
ncbi:hypothetical protein Ancab_013089 [Ancistrocladus abbreviatus]